MSLDILTQLYLERIKNVEVLSCVTVRNRYYSLGLFTKYLEAHKIRDVNHLELSHVKDFFAHYAEDGHSHNAIDTIRKHVRYFLMYIHEEENIPLNFDPKKVKGIGVARVMKTTIDKEVVYRVTKDIDDMQLKLINVLLFESGIRISELVTLRAEHIGPQCIGVLGKGRHGGKWRKAFISPELAGILKDFCQYTRRTEGYVFRRWQDHKNCETPHISADTVRQKLKPYYLRYGVHFSPHLARHTFAQELLTNGADVRTIQECLGHARLDTTQNYLQVPDAFIVSAYQKAMPTTMLSAA